MHLTHWLLGSINDYLSINNDAKQVDETSILVPSPRPLEAASTMDMLYVSFIRISVRRLGLESGYLYSGLALCFTNDNRPTFGLEKPSGYIIVKMDLVSA